MTLAAANGHVNIVKMFLKAESDSTTQGQSKNKAFTLALAHGYPEIVDLLQKGIPQEQADAALLEASQTGQRDMVKVLVENGANPYYENEEGENAFTVAPRDRIRSTILKSRNKNSKSYCWPIYCGRSCTNSVFTAKQNSSQFNY